MIIYWKHLWKLVKVKSIIYANMATWITIFDNGTILSSEYYHKMVELLNNSTVLDFCNAIT